MKNILLPILLYFSLPAFAQMPTAGLLAWYPFCGNANDHSGSARDLAVSGPVLTKDRFGRDNCAYYFSGTTSYASNVMTYTPIMPTDGVDFTYSAWFRCDAATNAVIWENGDCNYTGYEVVISGPSLYTTGYYVTVVFGNVNMFVPTAFTPFVWHHVVLRRSSTTGFDLFLDNTLAGSFSSSFYPSPTTNDFAVGQDYTNGSNSFTGAIDDIAVYDRALSDSEIARLFVFDPDADSFSLGRDTMTCGSSYLLKPLPSGIIGNYLWSTGSSDTDISVSVSGHYWLDISNNYGCLYSDSILLIVGGIPVSLGPDTGFCAGKALLLSSNAPTSVTYLWSTGATTPTISIDTPGTYWLEIYSDGCIGGDTINIVQYATPVVQLANDTTICAGGHITLASADTYSGATYAWSNGNTSAGITVSTAGSYWLAVTKDGCTGSDTEKITIRSLPAIGLGYDTSFCQGDSVLLQANVIPDAQYKWSTGSTADAIFVAAAGKYLVSVTDSGCIGMDSAWVSVNDLPGIAIPGDTFICSGESLLLIPHFSQLGHIQWSDGSSGDSLTVTTGGDYWVTVTNSCGSVTDTVHVNSTICNIWVPSAFTPNNVGHNDVIKVGHTVNYNDFSFGIYNRWGQRVYYSQDIDAGWNGKFNGTPQDVGTYFYLVQYSFENKKKMLKGSIELIR